MENLINLVEQVQQRSDRAAITETTLQRISRGAANEIWERAFDNPTQIAAIIYRHFRDGKEL